ncbi:acetyl-CoA synthetase-like protein [Backusella circina FSU 941]|nr:acetyl-CoA synthetase-like protein [Backusella circina FSU 941]
MLPSSTRDIPFKVIDLQDKKELNQFENIAQLLRYRASSNPTRLLPAMTVIDAKGKEATTLSWDKLGARAEKVAMVIKEKSSLQMGDRIGLVYQKAETLDFIVALFGCFLAGMVAVPINATEDLAELWFILSISNTHLVLTTENNLKTLTKTIKARNTEFPKGLDWWPIDDFGSLYPNQMASGKYSTISTSPLAYIEYTKSMNGELKGVAVSHKAIMNNCYSFIGATTETIEFINDQGVTTVYPNWDTQGADVVLTYLEHRQQVGLSLSIFCSVYNGNHTIYAGTSITENPSVWIYAISKYRVTIALASYPGAYFAATYYQKNTKQVTTFSKKVPPNLSSLRLLLIDALIVQPEVNAYIASKLIRPLSTKSESEALDVITPLASLPEHGGMILGFRDYLNPRKQDDAFSLGASRDIWECTLDAEALRMKKVVVLSSRLNEVGIQNEPGTLRVSSHGHPFPNSTVAIVDPDTALFCPPETVGEIWVDAPSVPDGFWGIPSLTDAIYHANPTLIHSEMLLPEKYGRQFVRTGVLGTMIGGRLVILGTYEDCVRQQQLAGEGEGLNRQEIHIGSDIVNTVARKANVDACTLFEICLNRQCLPVLAMESNAPINELPNIANNVYNILNLHHGLRLYTIVITKKGSLPRYLKDGNRYIHHLITKHRYLSGQLPAIYVKLDVDNTVFTANNNSNMNNGFNSIWQTHLGSYEKALFMKIIPPRSRPQHTGIDFVRTVIDERTGYDLSKFSNIVDMMIWRTSLFPEENAFVSVTQNSNSISTKPYPWRKVNNQIATLAYYLTKKKNLRPGTKVLVLVPFGLDLVITLYACFVTGLIPLLLQPPDPNKSESAIQENTASMVRAIKDLTLSHMLVNNQSEEMLRHKNVQPSIKLAMIKANTKRLPEQVNVGKGSRYNKMLGKESGFFVSPNWIVDRERPAMMLKSAFGDRQEYIMIGHDTLLAQCRAQKVTCQIKFQKPLIVNGFDGYENIGFLHSMFCGVYVGCTTILISEHDIYTSTSSYFELISRNKSINVCGSYSLFDFLMSKCDPSDQRRIDLRSIQNYMITTFSRTKPLHYERISRFLSLSGVGREFVSTVYSHPLNPMVSTRSYMMLEPISLVADLKWLQLGIVRPIIPKDDIYSVLLHDSGIVPNNTMIAIVNPETMMVCPSHAIGEIWVSSECNVRGIHGLDSLSHTNKFEATLNGTDPRNKYMRTGDLGFLWTVQRKTMGVQVSVEEGQCLYVLGRMDEVISEQGMMYFPHDIEETVENCHPDIIPDGSYAIKSDKEIIIVATIKPNSTMIPSLASLIVNAVLECHELLVDTVVLANRDHIPRKINGEKRRKQVLSLYNQKKM